MERALGLTDEPAVRAFLASRIADLRTRRSNALDAGGDAP
jgi:hypothetical protein